ncbi:uncharacterized protein LOC114539690 [Dendronephthya gigantea]|uniref:uncharacterized protein LOC114539690 n=1 Tax=Dendronephthya gigantea TaxID=151771 RepID=UPI0010696FCA|nr:uncharacterized protein LOC114539690 [Dendronephthya gigantea]
MILSGPKNPKSVVRSILDPIIEARHVRIHPGYMKGQNVCMRLELYGCAFEKDVKGVPVQDPTVSMYENYKSGCAGLTTNSIVMFFAGVATTLGTVLLVVFIFRIRRRNYEVSKLATGINAVHTAVETQTEHAIDAPAVVVLIEPVTKPPPQNIQNIEYAVPENSRTCPYEQVDDSPPVPSVYTGLDIIRRDGRETDDRNYQKLLKRESDYVIPANSVSDSPDEEGRGEFKSKTPLGYTELDLTKLGQTNNPPYQHLIRRPSKPLH